ncbi:MAG: hypothetical protein ACNS63_04270 [Candidatus Nitrospinota bacterium M3_3B_026]
MNRIFLAAALAGATLAVPDIASAMAEPGAGDFAYDLYDIAINKIQKGPIGFVGGWGAMLFGAVLAARGAILQAIPTILAGAAILKADTIVTTLGAII